MSPHNTKDEKSPFADELEDVKECRICGERSFHLALEVRSWRLMQCDACGIVFTSPRYTHDTLSRIYGSNYYEVAADYFESKSSAPSEEHIRIARQAARYVRGHQPVAIDIGTGCGQIVAAFSAIGFKARGTEPNALACETAQKNGRDVMDVAIEDLPSETYDCVVALHVLEHVPEPRQFVHHMARIAVPGGVVMIEVPNFASVASRKLGANWTALYPNTHLFQFTPATLAYVCKLSGLTVIATHRVGGAGFCADVADTQRKSGTVVEKKTANVTIARYVLARLKRFIWTVRKPLLMVPGLRSLLRWLNWEVLGHGEYVRIIARKG